MSATGIILGTSLTLNILAMNLAWIVPLVKKFTKMTKSWIVGFSPSTGAVEIGLHKVKGSSHIYRSGNKEGLLAWEPDQVRRTRSGQPVYFADLDSMHGIGPKRPKHAEPPKMRGVKPYDGQCENDEELTAVKQSRGPDKVVPEPVWKRFPGDRILRVIRGGWMKELNDNTSPLVALAQALAVPALILAAGVMLIGVIYLGTS